MKQPGFEQNIIGAPSDMRRRQIAAIIAWGLIALCVGNLVTIPVFSAGVPLDEILRDAEVRRIGLSSILGIAIAFAALILLRAKLVMLPGVLISAGFTLLILSADDFIEVAGGRSTIFLAIPVLIAAITIRPAVSFVAAGVSTTILMLHPDGMMAVNVYAIGAIWMLALCIWLATSLMERAIVAAQLETQRVRAMLGVVSHELRTPLGSINGYSDLLALSGEMSALQSEMLGRIKSAAGALTAMVNRILDTAHIQSGKMTLKPERVSTRELFSPLNGSAQRQALDKGLKFEFNITDLPEFILIDAARFQQIVSNLIDNAVKYTESGRIEMTASGAENKLRVAIRDTGIGIPPESLQSVFQEFAQVEHFATRAQGGVGLGLFIVHSLANLMGGQIAVESEVGKGTVFTVTLPLH